ncbi:hypothetical protein NMY22_g19430 [Coprinellus aureogranulatus]|nr:hypothetical protein NMY22_g19430 [Coprinellus aureogranulatus]
MERAQICEEGSLRWESDKGATTQGTAGGWFGGGSHKQRREGGCFPPCLLHGTPETVELEAGQWPEEFDVETVTDDDIREAIGKLQPYKAPGPNGISNSVFTHCADILIPYLGPIFRATFTARHYPSRWKVSKTIVLRKPGRADYGLANSYRPIALMDTMSKLLSSCVKTKIEYWVEVKGLLPKNQFGGRPGRTTTDSLHMLMSFIKGAWRKGQEVMALFLDVKGAFPSVVVPVLLKDMEKRGVPKDYRDWFSRKLEGRKTIIAFDDYQSSPVEVKMGLDQGCTSSPLVYNFYNADQVEGLMRKGETGAGFAGDAYGAVAGADLEDAARRLEEMYSRDGGLGTWARSHHAKYEVAKFGLVCFTRHRKRVSLAEDGQEEDERLRPSVWIEGFEVKPSQAHKYLGVMMDEELRFREHTAAMLERGTRWLAQFRRLVRATSGVAAEHARRIFLGAAVPMTLYAADVWYEERRRRGAVVKDRVVVGIERMQRQAALALTGAYRSTPTDMLQVYAGLPPARVHIEKVRANAAARIATLPRSNPLHAIAARASRCQVKRHRAPIHNLMRLLRVPVKEVEKIPPVRRKVRGLTQVRFEVDKSKEEALEREVRNDAELRVYTDGSVMEGST